MKKIIALFLFIQFFIITSTSYAADTVEFKIKGVSGEILKNITGRLSIINEHQLSYQKSSNQIAKGGVEEIKKAMQPYGYFEPIISYDFIRKNKKQTIVYLIELGIPVRINIINIKLFGVGKNNQQLNNFLQDFPIKTGDVFDAEHYNKAKEKIVSLANNEGYIKGYFQKSNVFINTKAHRASIILFFQTGSLYKFGPITFKKNYYSSVFLQRFVHFNSNENFSNQKINTLQQKLSNSYYFQQAQISPEFDQILNNKVPLKVNLVPPKSQHYSMRLGYGSLTGLRFISDLSLRRLTNTGQHFDAQLKLSPVLSGISGKYYIPGAQPLTDSWVGGFDFQRFLPSNGQSSSATLTAGYLKKADKLQTSVDLNYLIDRYQEKGLIQTTNKLLYPNFSISYAKADDIINPSNGKSFQLILRGASKITYSSVNFFQAEIRAKYLFSPTNFSHFIVRTDLGYTLVNDLNNLPLTLRFFAGGTNSVRGYRDSSIGPGRFLKVGSIEYQNHIRGNWTGAIFYDVGSASNNWNTPFSRSGGIGLIYQSIVGPIKLYLVKTMDKKSGSFAIDFNIGPEF